MALTLTFTNAGFARFTAAQLGNGTDLRISAVGVSDNAIVVAPTLTALPGEIRRFPTVSGSQVGDNIVHLIVRDDAEVTYGFRAFGLYLSDGTLFAVYAQAARIMEKTALASNMLAIDIAFPAANVASISFGATNFLNPPATTTTKGIVELATDQETIDGADTLRAVTPKGLKARLADILVTLANVVPFGRRINTTGLATGGRTLDVDLTIDVPRATVAEADAGLSTTKALTPSSLANILVNLANSVPFGRKVNTIGLATGGRTLDADITIDVPRATAAEADAGTLTTKALTPSSLANILVLLANSVPFGRKVNTIGLVTGGRTLDADITIDVPRATAAEADAGTLTTKALTPSSLANILVLLANSVPFGRKINTIGLATGGRTLDTDITIDVPRALAAEADAGELTTKALTPSSLTNILASILARTPMTRRVDTSGLAIGGNSLATDITISVPPATAAQLLAGSASNVAATPAALAAAGNIYLIESKSDGASRYRRFSDGSVEMLGVSGLPGSEAGFTLNFPWPFPTACDGIFCTIINSGQSNDGQSTVQEVSLGAASAQLYAQNHKSPTADAAGGFRWFARGR